MPEIPHTLPDDALDEINRLWTVARVYSNTAHDVNNALQVISGSAELLLSREGLDERTTRRLSAIRVQAGRAAAMIGGLLSYVRETDEAADTIDLALAVGQATAMRAASLGRAEIQVEVTRSQDEPFMVSVQWRKTLQLLLNLFLMAEARIAPGRSGRIDVRLDRAGGSIALTISSHQGDGEPRADSTTPRSHAALLFADLQRESVPRLAAGQGAVLSMPEVSDPTGRLTLTLPAAS